ncbi:hypothetical protein [Streptomyces adustus]|uniref:hypothetical protein n=1 Tax=Streptomyces adustus TaxID=1609272 RepID=UPI0013914797
MAYYTAFIGGLVMSPWLNFHLRGSQFSAFAFVPIVVSLCLALFAAFSLDRRPPGDSESRRRVLDAERELEEALRRRPPVFPGGVGQGEVPHQRAPESADAALVLPELWKVTHSRLDHYHETVLGQARRSFRSAQLAMWLGFLLLVAFVIVAVRASSTAGAVVAGGLGAVSAALAGYVGRTFMKSQEAASAHLRAYFDQPLAFSRYLAAERLLRNSELEGTARAEVVAALVLAVADVPGAGSTGRQEGAAAENGQAERSPAAP